MHVTSRARQRSPDWEIQCQQPTPQDTHGNYDKTQNKEFEDGELRAACFPTTTQALLTLLAADSKVTDNPNQSGHKSRLK